MKYIKFLYSPAFMGILFLSFALSMAVATFIENDFGSAAAYSIVYNTRWFELILLLLIINLIGQIFEYKLYKKTKLTVFFFHAAFIVMITGAGITRYFGYEGSIHIREGKEENRCYSTAKYIGYSIKDINGNLLAEQSRKYSLSSRTADNYKSRISVNGEEYAIVLENIIPNATESISESHVGVPVVSLMITSPATGMENVILREGEIKRSGNYTLGLDSRDSADVSILVDSGSFYINSRYQLSEKSMVNKEGITYQKGTRLPLKPMQILELNDMRIIIQKFSIAGIVKPVQISMSEQETGLNAFIFSLTAGGKPASVTLWDQAGKDIASETISIDGKNIELFYGSKITELPYSIKLNDFTLERYPGSNSPSGYKSDVVLIDKVNGTEKPFLIFMNNILKYKGYRFYQSSFDKDEMGTVLSVNHDNAGMLVSYFGYGILFLFIILSIVNKNSAFRNVTASFWRSPFRKSVTVVIMALLLSGLSAVNGQKLVADKKAAEEFGKVLVQDQKGRTKPLFTLSNDILRKVSRENEFDGLSSMQVFLGLYFDFQNWKEVPLIRVSNKDIQRRVGIRDNLASFNDLVDLSRNGAYKLSDDVEKAYGKAPGERDKYDKEVMKVDERLNIVYMIYTGQFMKLFPLKDNTHNWGTAEEALPNAINKDDSTYLLNIMSLLADALNTNNISRINQIAVSVNDYQKRFSGYDLPSKSKTNAELLYYKAKIFEKLFPFYATLGLVLLITLLVMVIRGREQHTLFIKIPVWILFTGFLLHTFGLGLRWYIAGHSPMSNGYESMIFISWVTILAGFIFSRKSPFALSATAVLASMTLMVAHLSFMDPEITNLVPVLKSYWLTLHVSVITGSYGFLGLGAILGLITMILLSLSNKSNFERIGKTIDELTVINFKTLTLGLYFLTIGTFLGAVWANESWGRYWGWDPKETWSLITVVVYSLVLHSRQIPSLKDVYSFNIMSLFAFSCVLMTYFGVNYYLSGLHSYASGDPVPVPSFVYITVILLTALSTFAYMRYSSWKKVAK